MSQHDGGQVPQFAPNGSEADPLDSVPTLEGLIETGGDEVTLRPQEPNVTAFREFKPSGASVQVKE